jgi:hypothetical protein
MVANYETISWVEEIIGPARVAEHPSLGFLLVIASWCYLSGRTDEGVRYAEEAETIFCSGSPRVPFGIPGMGASAHLAVGRPDRWAEACRNLLAHDPDVHGLTRASLTMALTVLGLTSEAEAFAADLIQDSEASRNPMAMSWALLAYGYAFRESDPIRARDALRRGLLVAQESDNRMSETILAMTLGRAEWETGDLIAALDCARLSIAKYHDAGNIIAIRVPLAWLAALLDSIGHHQSAATIAGFAASPMSEATTEEFGTAIAHARQVLGEQTYDTLAEKGAAMTTATMVAFAFDQIDQARAEMNAVSNRRL